MMTDLDAISPLLLEHAKSRHPEPPRHLGTRYDTTGRFLPEPGNTVVCHLVEGSATAAALADARQRYLAMPEAKQLAFTPLSSLHMTLFQGIIEGRRALPYWPEDVALTTPIDQMTTFYAERLAAYAGGPEFKVRVTGAAPTGLKVEGATARDRQAMADWRDAFADLFGYRHPDHDDYVFHITFAYVIERFEDAALPAWQQMLDEVVADINRRAPLLDLRAPAFCSFEDMNHFEELVVFDGRA
jgi:hypothetical protein